MDLTFTDKDFFRFVSTYRISQELLCRRKRISALSRFCLHYLCFVLSNSVSDIGCVEIYPECQKTNSLQILVLGWHIQIP